jgi:hypothetical protein
LILEVSASFTKDYLFTPWAQRAFYVSIYNLLYSAHLLSNPHTQTSSVTLIVRSKKRNDDQASQIYRMLYVAGACDHPHLLCGACRSRV